MELQKGEIDLMEFVKTEDIETLKEIDELKIVPVLGREYDYIGWNNIDVNAFVEKQEIVPHKLFPIITPSPSFSPIPFFTQLFTTSNIISPCC